MSLLPGNVSFVETPKVNVADTVGAGDSFTATFVASILKGKTVREAHELAVEASAFVCTQNGLCGIPSVFEGKNLNYIVYLVKNLRRYVSVLPEIFLSDKIWKAC